MPQAAIRTGPTVNKLHHAWRPTDDIRETLSKKFPSLEFPYLESDHTHGVNSSVHCFCKEHETFTRISLSNALYDVTEHGCSVCAGEAGFQTRKAGGYSTKQYIGKRGVQAGIFRSVKEEFPDAIWEFRMKCGKEIDIYMPSIMAGVEYNGNYYHSTKIKKDENYHHNKSINGLEEGKEIFHVFTDEAVEPYTGIVNSLIVGYGMRKPTYTGKTKIRPIPRVEAVGFHAEWNFIFPNTVDLFCDLHIGHFIGGELMAVASGNRTSGFILRFSTKHMSINPSDIMAKFQLFSKTKVTANIDMRNPTIAAWLMHYLQTIPGSFAKTGYPLTKNYVVDWEAVRDGVTCHNRPVLWDSGCGRATL